MSGNQPNMDAVSPTNQAVKRLKSADADGDSTMNSSPERGPGSTDDDMFPDEVHRRDLPSTPQNAASFALGANPELSPPNSQGPSHVPRNGGLAVAQSGSPSINANGKRTFTSAPVAATDNMHTDAETGYRWSTQEDQPGWEWMSSRAREEEARALEQIVDKDSVIRSRSAPKTTCHGR